MRILLLSLILALNLTTSLSLAQANNQNIQRILLNLDTLPRQPYLPEYAINGLFRWVAESYEFADDPRRGATCGRCTSYSKALRADTGNSARFFIPPLYTNKAITAFEFTAFPYIYPDLGPVLTAFRVYYFSESGNNTGYTEYFYVPSLQREARVSFRAAPGFVIGSITSMGRDTVFITDVEFDLKTLTPVSNNLSVTDIILAGEPTENDKYVTSPNKPLIINVALRGNNFLASETRTANVSLTVGKNSLQTSVPVSEIKSAGTLLVPFEHSFDVDDVGEADIRATVSVTGDYTPEDDTFSDSVYVLCSVEDSGRSVPFYSQASSPWNDDPFGIVANSSRPGTIQKYGCSVVDFAMLLNSYGIDRTPLGSPLNPAINGTSTIPGINAELLDPGTLNLAFANYKVPLSSNPSVALNRSNNPIWEGMAEVARAGYRAKCTKTGACDPNNSSSAISLKEVKLAGFNNDPKSVDNKKIYRQICEGNPVILKFAKQSGGGQHYMLTTGIRVSTTGEITYRVNNPGSVQGRDQVYDNALKARYPTILGYSLYHPSADPSMMTLAAPLGVHFVVTDPLGRRAGYDPISQVAFAEIPGSSYGMQSVNTPDEPDVVSETLTAENFFTSTQDVPPGNYTISMYSLNGGAYYLDYRTTDAAGYANGASYQSGTLEARQSIELNYIHSIEPSKFPNSTIKISSFIITQRNKRFLDIGVVMSGRMTPLDGSKLRLRDSFRLKLGGETGLTIEVAATQFKTLPLFKSKRYIYLGRDVKVLIDESGLFEIVISNGRTGILTREQAQSVSIEIDQYKAVTQVPLKCSKSVCTQAGN